MPARLRNMAEDLELRAWQLLLQSLALRRGLEAARALAAPAWKPLPPGARWADCDDD